MRQGFGQITLDNRDPNEDEGDDGDGDQRLLIPAEHLVPSVGYPLIRALLMQDLGLLLLRIVAGVTLAGHGYPKLVGGPGKRPHPLVAGYGQGGYEFSLLLGTAALSLALTSPGRLSID